MLTQAIERNSAVVLSLPSAGMVRYHKSRFLRADAQRVWLESVPSERKLIESLIQEKLPVVVSFKVGLAKVNFQSPILEVDDKYKFFDTQDAVTALLMERPALVKPLQRRTHFRVTVRPEDNFKIQVWRIAEHVNLKDEPMDLFKLSATVRDLSVGGIGVIFESRPLLVAEQRMRILLSHGTNPPMLIEGRSGPVRQDQAGECYEAGIEFRELQASLQGRQMQTELTRIVNGLQLREAKRLRAVAG
jgi:c-di-GMP-binding flagellar brake protein YcgR